MSHTKIRGVVFDKDGTLLRHDRFWLPVATPAITALLKSRDLDATLVEEMLCASGAYEGASGLLYHGTYEQIGNAFNSVLCPRHPQVSPFTGEETAAAFAAAARYGELVATCEDIRGLFTALQARGLKIAVVTTDTTPLTRHCLEVLDILDLVDYIYGDDGLFPTKPDPYYMNCFCRELGCSPQEVLMVGDSANDMRFATNSGTHSLAVCEEAACREALRPLAEFVAPDISATGEILDRLEGTPL